MSVQALSPQDFARYRRTSRGTDWTALPEHERYLWKYLGYHMREAGAPLLYVCSCAMFVGWSARCRFPVAQSCCSNWRAQSKSTRTRGRSASNARFGWTRVGCRVLERRTAPSMFQAVQRSSSSKTYRVLPPLPLGSKMGARVVNTFGVSKKT